MQCLGEKNGEVNGGIREGGKKTNSTFSQSPAELFLSFNDRFPVASRAVLRGAKAGPTRLCNPFKVGN